MTIQEQEQFNEDLNSLLEKYRLSCFVGIYISKPGKGEKTGITGAYDMKDKRAFEKMKTLLPAITDIFNSL